MSPGPSRLSAADRSRGQGSLAVKTVTLMVVAGCAILLWLFAVPRVGEALYALSPPPEGVHASQGEIVSCPGADLARHCRVRYTTSDGVLADADLVRSGLFDVTVGERLPVRVQDGLAVVSGWRPVVDALLLIALACAFTGYAVGRWRVVLEHGDEPYTPEPGELDDLDRF